MQIPYGKVSCYGEIAAVINMPRHSRHVGQSLKHLRSYAPQLDIPPENIPWWRVINSSGGISKRQNPQEEELQLKLLLDEGVEVVNGRIDLVKYSYVFQN